MSFVLDRIAKEYGSGSTKTIALAGVSLAARPAEFLSIVGPSGCGKTTLLKILAGLIAPSSGTLTFSESEERAIFAASKQPVTPNSGTLTFSGSEERAIFAANKQPVTPSEVEEPGARVAARDVSSERRPEVNPAHPASTSLRRTPPHPPSGHLLPARGEKGDRQMQNEVVPPRPACGERVPLSEVEGAGEGRVIPSSASPRAMPWLGMTSTGKLPTALVFQDHGLLPWYDVLENVTLGLRFQNVPRATARERARHFIEQVGLGAFQHHRPHQLSIGMRQRVGIARAFVADPEILLLDEPFGSLDAQTRLVLQQELLRIWQEHRRVVVHVTHDIDEAILLSDRIAVMSGRPGTIREELPVPFARPRTLDVLATPVAVALRRRIWSILEEEVRESLAVPK